MKNLIKNILKEQWSDETYKLPEKVKLKLWKMFDKMGIDKTIEHVDFELDALNDLVVGYFQEYPNPKYDPEIELIWNSSEISKLFSSDMQEIVEKYLDDDWDYQHSECFDYDGNWMLDNINEENMSFMRKSAIAAVGEDEDEIEEYIGERFGSLIGCTHSEVQQDADINELHKDIDISIEDFFNEIPVSKWDTGIFDGKMRASELSKSNFFGDVMWEELEYGGGINWDDLGEKIMEYELERVGDRDATFFPEKMYFNEDKHFRYGGAGDMDKEYFNELLYDRLQEEIDVE